MSEVDNTNEKTHEGGAYETDAIFKEIGEFGLYQGAIFVIVSLIAMVPALTAYSYVYNGATPDHRCKLLNYPNDTFEIQSAYHQELVDMYVPPPGKSSVDSKYDNCHLKSYDSNSSVHTNDSYHLETCGEYVYSKKYYHETIVTKWNMVCDKEVDKGIYLTLYFAGYFGVIIIGLLGDKFGRKKIAYVFVIANSVVNALIAILINLNLSERAAKVSFAVLRFSVGVTSNVYIIAMVSAIEIVGPKYRVTAANSVYYFYVLGELITVLLAYFLRDFRTYYIPIAVINAVFVLYFWIVPESPRYLITHNKANEADKIFKRIAKSNKRTYKGLESSSVNDDLKSKGNLVKSEPEEYGLFQSVKMFVQSKKLIIRTLVTLLNWFGNTFVYDGLSFSIGALAGDPFLNNLYSALVELAGVIASHVAYTKLGRKIPYTATMFLAGASLVCISFVPTKLYTVIVVLALVGKFAISFSFNGVYIVTAEIYPTTIRNSAISICSAFSRIGGVIAPYVMLLSSKWYPLPYLIYGSTSLIAGLTFLIVMPETKKAKMADTVNEMEN